MWQCTGACVTARPFPCLKSAAITGSLQPIIGVSDSRSQHLLSPDQMPGTGVQAGDQRQGPCAPSQQRDERERSACEPWCAVTKPRRMVRRDGRRPEKTLGEELYRQRNSACKGPGAGWAQQVRAQVAWVVEQEVREGGGGRGGWEGRSQPQGAGWAAPRSPGSVPTAEGETRRVSAGER